MKQIILIGAGKQGRTAASLYRNMGREIRYFVDNDVKKQGSLVLDISVISFEDFLKLSDRGEYEVIISCGPEIQQIYVEELNQKGIDEYSLFDLTMLL